MTARNGALASSLVLVGGLALAGCTGFYEIPIETPIQPKMDLAKYDKIFADVAYWKKLGEEYQTPLIVTGTVLFTPHQANGFVMQNREVYDSFGRRSVIPVRTYQERKGFILQPRFVFIDGRT